MKSDVFWSLFAMPIGVMLCFGPAILIWLFSGDTAPVETPVKKSDKH